MAFYFEKTAKRKWAFFREAAERMFWPKLDREYQEEIEGIAEGVKACRPETAYDRVDLTALNSWLELAWYYGNGRGVVARRDATDLIQGLTFVPAVITVITLFSME
jgi:hypothetical protein